MGDKEIRFVGKRIKIHRLIAIIKKEFIQIVRDPVSLRLPLFMPIVMMFLFGYAVKTEVDKIPTAIFDRSKTRLSREYIEKFVASNYFSVKYYVSSDREISDLIDQGKARACLIIPGDYADSIKKNKSPQTQLIIDGTDPTTARTAFNSGLLVSEIYSRDMKEKKLKKIGISVGNISGVDINTKVWYNPNLDNNRFTIPGLIGLILQNITIMITAFSLVREKERGTIEQLMVTPVRPTELIIGKLIPYIIIGYLCFLFTLVICVFWFRVSLSGNFWLLLILSFIFVFCSLSIGILISTFAKNQMQAMMVVVFVYLPSVILSGFIFPRQAMPIGVRLIGYLIPLTYYTNIVRGIFLKGIGMTYLWLDVVALLVFTAVILFIAIKRFRKSLD